MEFEKPSTIEVQKKDLSRLYGLTERLENYVDDPYLDEMKKTLRRLLHMDEQRHEPED